MFDVFLVAAALGCALVSGLLLGFAVVAMPGIAKLDDRGFVRAFQVMDGVIQGQQPIFMLVWVGSVIATIGAVATGLGEVDGPRQLTLLGAGGVYLLGVQAPTAAINIPLNNAIQAVDLTVASDEVAAAARAAFETRWNTWNRIRTLLGVLASLGFLLVLLGR